MEQKEILVDQTLLRQKSGVVTDIAAIQQEIADLLAALPNTALGLAAPQIGVFKQFFVANLSSGRFLFINPNIEWVSPDQIPSTEACLSLPGVNRCVLRHFQINISAEKILKADVEISEFNSNTMRLKSLDACIFQHEFDHLHGILIIDLPEVKNSMDKAADRLRDREARIQRQRGLDNNSIRRSPSHVPAKNNRQITKEKKAARRERIKLRKRIEAQQRQEIFNEMRKQNIQNP